MTIDELEERLSAVQHRRDDEPGLTFVARSSRGLGVRPTLLQSKANGERVYMVTVGQLRRMIARARAIQATP